MFLKTEHTPNICILQLLNSLKYSCVAAGNTATDIVSAELQQQVNGTPGSFGEVILDRNLTSWVSIST